MIRKIVEYLNHGTTRSIKAKKNIAAIFLIKGASILSTFILIPLSIDLVDPVRYGIWLTLASVLSWIGLFDLGMGNGLRNRLAEALAKDDADLGKAYVSTTYAVFTLVSVVAAILFFLVQPFLNWATILNVDSSFQQELALLASIMFVMVLFQFILRNIGFILLADQRPAWNNALNLMANFLTLSAIGIMNYLDKGGLLELGLVMGAAPVLVFLVASVLFFKSDYKFIRPSWETIQFKYFKDLGSLGIQFFILQASALILFTTDNIIIAHVMGPENVTPYHVAVMYFSVVGLIFNILLAPMWSATTEAYVKGDFPWIKRVIKKAVKFWGLSVVGVIFMIIVSDKVYEIWLGDSVKVPILLSILMGVYQIIVTFIAIFVSFINGVGKLRVQIIHAVFVGILNIPLSIFLATQMGLGLAGVILATCICQFIGMVWTPIQYHKIITQTAKGVWNK